MGNGLVRKWGLYSQRNKHVRITLATNIFCCCINCAWCISLQVAEHSLGDEVTEGDGLGLCDDKSDGLGDGEGPVKSEMRQSPQNFGILYVK